MGFEAKKDQASKSLFLYCWIHTKISNQGYLFLVSDISGV